MNEICAQYSAATFFFKMLGLEAWGIEPQTSPMRTERSTPELCPRAVAAELSVDLSDSERLIEDILS
ncbi:unnamed protein product [Litomosoides sigmodontis]|uniref:Uncharacterized protein n=1 Tax=Litomosoides sigmodontis TaxID=42156 RepID=A0A3P6TNT5_LITSI|nr:unnamed protein product [Litomosoides sigmodontis]